MATATIIDGKARAAALRQALKASIAAFVDSSGVTPGLAVILVGDDPASGIYVRRKAQQAREVGIRSLVRRLPAETPEVDLLAVIDELNQDPLIHGILVQLPLPPQIAVAEVLAAISPDKDVDGFHVLNVGRLAAGQPGLAPCTPLGCMVLLRGTLDDLRGRHALVVGRSAIVGKPMARLLVEADCTVTIAHRHTQNLAELCRLADIVVVAVGIPGLIRGAWLKPGAVVIDVGINRVPTPDGGSKIVGDVAFEEALTVAGAITPVPGGVGPMTIVCLLMNTLQAAEALRGADQPAPRRASGC